MWFSQAVAFIHIDSWHRTGSNITDQLQRFMLKLHYVRMEEPCVAGPSWDHDPDQRAWTPQQDDRTPSASQATWDWLCGDEAPEEEKKAEVAVHEEHADEREAAAAAASAVASLRDPTATETARVEMTLALGRRAQTDPHVVPALIEELRSAAAGGGGGRGVAEDIAWDYADSQARGTNPASMRGMNPADTEVAHALSAAGSAALPALLNALEQEEGWWVTSVCASVLGGMGHVARDASAADQARLAEGLLAALAHPNEWVRWNAASALGTVAPVMAQLTDAIAEAAVAGLSELLDAEQEQETVRLSAAISLGRLVGGGRGWSLGARGVSACACAMRERRDDRLNGTTRHHCCAALRRDGSAAAMEALVDALMLSRWL